jgi:hypothetical protein
MQTDNRQTMNEGHIHVRSTEGREHVGHSPVSCTVEALA